MGGVNGRRKENISEWRKREEKNKERDILMERAIKWLQRNLVLEKLPGILKDDPRKDF